jgi:hypothetical protein
MEKKDTTKKISLYLFNIIQQTQTQPVVSCILCSMQIWQRDFILIYTIGAFLFALKGLYESVIKKNPYGQQTIWMNLYGAFVWADAVVLATFWFLAGIVLWYLNNWQLFLLMQSIFWFIRSIGETLYWFLVQFSQKETDPPERFWLSRYFPGTSVWFINQMFWQCVTVTSLIFSIYFGHKWLAGLS